jgi:hypothetical protein
MADGVLSAEVDAVFPQGTQIRPKFGFGGGLLFS